MLPITRPISGTALGECVFMRDQPEPLLTLDSKVYLKSGNLIFDEETNYPEAYAAFATVNTGNVYNWLTTDIPVNINYACYGNGIYLCMAWNGSKGLGWSSDGINWTALSGPFTDPNQICFFNGYFYITGSNTGESTGNVNPRIYRCDDPRSNAWVLVCSSVPANGYIPFNEIAAGNGILVAVSSYVASNTNNYVTSTDGVTWTRRSTSLIEVPKTLVFVNGYFLCTGINGNMNANLAMYSATGTTWTNWSALKTALGASSRFNVEFAYGAGIWVAVDSYGYIYTATSVAGTWTQRLSTGGPSTGFNSVTYDGTYFIACGKGGVYTSVNGIDWLLTDSGATGVEWLLVYPLQTGSAMLYGHGKAAYKRPHKTIGISTFIERGGSPLYMRIK